MDNTVVTRVCQELKGTAALQFDCIFQEGEIGNNMYFVVEGEVHTTCEAKHLLTTDPALVRVASSGSKRAEHKLRVRATCLQRRRDKTILAPEWAKDDKDVSQAFVDLLETLETGLLVHRKAGHDGTKSVDFFAGEFAQVHRGGQWTLGPTGDDASTGSSGSAIGGGSSGWVLTHARSGLTGTLSGTMPLGESMWRWTGVAGVPTQEIPLSIVVFVGRHKRHSYFGERTSAVGLAIPC